MFPLTPPPPSFRLLSLLVLLFGATVSPAADPPPPPAPRRVTLDDRPRTPDAILAEITSQTKLPVADRRNSAADQPLSLPLRNATYWEALDQLATRLDARVDVFSNDGVPALVAGPRGMPLVCHSGVFRVEVRRLSSTVEVSSQSRLTRVALDLAWEPGLRPLLLNPRPESARVSLVGQGAEAGRAQAGGATAVQGKTATTLEIQLTGIPREAKSIDSLQGELIAIAASRMLTFRFETLDSLQSRPATRKREDDGIQVTVGEPTLEADRWSIDVRVRNPDSNPVFESFQSWTLFNEMYLERKDGKGIFPANGGSSEFLDRSGGEFTYHFVDDLKAGRKRGRPGDWYVVYRTPGPISRWTIPFRFKDVPLP